MSIIDTIINTINYINALVWGLPAVIILAGTGLAVSVLSGFAQIRYFRKALKIWCIRALELKARYGPSPSGGL